MSYVDMDCVALAHGGVASIATSYVTAASISPGANRLCLLAIHSAPNGGANPPNQPTVTGAGMTWVAVRTQVAPGGIPGQARLTVFRALKASPGSGQLTFDFGGQQQTGYQYAVLELTPVDTSGSDGSGAIGDFSSGVFCPGSSSDPARIGLTFDVGNVPDVNQRVVSFFTNSNRTHDAHPGLHATEVSDDHGAGPPPYVAMQSQVGLSDAVSATYYRTTGQSTYFLILGVAIAVKPATLYGSGPTDHPEFHLELSTSTPNADVQDWHDISDDARAASIEWGRSNEDDEFGAGTQSYVLDNSSGDYRRSNTTGRFYGNLKRFRNVRSFLVWKGARVWLAYGRIETIIPTREGDYGEVEMNCNDGREQLANTHLSTGTASASLSGGKVSVVSSNEGEKKEVSGWPPDPVLYTPGGIGSQSSVTLRLTSNQPVTSVEDTGTKVTVNLRSSGGVSLATGEEVANAINAHATAGRRLKASGTTGVVSSTSETPLAGSWSSEGSGARINRALDNIRWAGDARVIDAGSATIQASQFALADKVAITAHLRDIEVSEGGQLFIDPQRRIVFQGSGARSAAPFNTPLFTVVDQDPEAGEYCASAIDPNEDSTFIRTQVTVSRAGGGSSTATADQSHLDDYGTRDHSFDTILNSDTALAARASAYLAAHQDEKDRYDQIVLDPVTAGRAIYDILVQASISHRVRVKENSAPGSSALSSDHFIEGIQFEFTIAAVPFHWIATYRLSPV